ncbi:MAG: Calcineurin-like phosphoesterase [Deltaproteobacteria bacterium ADurb.Bin072]|nr:MAG: Calcineurin-like phosphoesterase [Deltaproteobacteria bacterium ADurb.Bin072]
MKTLYASDLHGRVNLYGDLMELASRSAARLVILGGDLFPTIIPNPVTLINGRADFQNDLKGQLRFVESYLAPTLRDFLSARPGVRLLYIPGNHDWIPAVKRFEEALPGAMNIHARTVSLNGHDFLGYACVTDSTFWVKDYARRDRTADPYVPSRFAIVSGTDRLLESPGGEYAQNSASMEEDLSGVRFDAPGRAICVFHCPPYDTGLDTLHNGRPIGSRAIRSFLEDRQPLLSLHGHIHEAPYMSGFFRTRIGKTTAANPGCNPETLHALILDTDDPEASLTHTVFGKTMPMGDLQGLMPERRMRKVRAFFMERVLKG